MRRTFAWAIAAMLLAAAGASAAEKRYEIQLLEKSWTPPAGVSAAALQDLNETAGRLAGLGQEKIHVLVQLYEIPDAAQKNQLWRDGLELGAYVPGNAWIAAVPASEINAVAGLREVRTMIPWGPERKLSPRLKVGDVASWARDPERPEWVMTFVQLHHDVDISRIFDVAGKAGGVVMEPIEGLNGATVWVPAERLAELAGVEDVLWVEEGPPPLSPTNDGARANMRADAVIGAPYNLTGTGVRVFVFDGGSVRATHETFNTGGASRVTVIDAQAASDHPTHVAGTVGGDGAPTSSGGRGRGVATGTTLLSAGYEQSGGTMLFWDNAGDIQADYALARNTHNADMGTNSIGSNTASNGYDCAREGDYGVSSNMLDGIARGDNATVGSPVIFTWANGNERSGGSPRGRCGANYVTTAPPSCAKNPIHIGALNSDGGSMTNFSSWGPCDDGRMKPVVSAPGCETGRVTGETAIYSSLNTSDTAYGAFCGTSMATPATAGVVALFIQDWRAHTGAGANARPMPALMKAMLVHSARDLGQDGPDYIYGYGAVDAKNLIDLLRADNGVLGDGGTTAWGTDSITNGAIDNFSITVPAGTAELKATLAWDDAAAAAFSANAVVNNLTLQLIAPDATVRQAWVLDPANPHLPATTGLNGRDNQEQVLVTNPAAGTWTVRVTGTSVPTGPQTYGLTYATKASDGSTCSTTFSSGFESGADGWTLSGASQVAAPAAGHGSFSLRFGNAASTTHEATRDVAIPAGATKAEWTFFWYMTTNEVAASGFGWDFFYAEVRNTAGTPLAVFDVRNDGWRQAAWMGQENIDLSPWAGQTVRLAFRATNDSSLPTTFYVDDVVLSSCTTGGGGPVCGDGIIQAPEVCDGANLGGQTCVSQGFSGGTLACAASCLAFNTSGCTSPPVTVTFYSVAAQDGRIWESGETGNVGGGGNSTDNTTAALRVGDTNADEQYKNIVSFDTSSIPDTATVTAATLRLVRGTLSGTNPFGTHGSCVADIITGGFGGSTAFAIGDWQAAATATSVATMSNPTTNGAASTGTLNASGRAAINKTGTTQLRVYFTLDDNDDLGFDYIGFYPGENATQANRPQLTVTYQP
ncbi:MAG TPA: S8 family serine peptidase [Thermoanaerobaculia bacterium]|nr:S8 family serine peptidase [Thermoanaerobaculia bacterium]